MKNILPVLSALILSFGAIEAIGQPLPCPPVNTTYSHSSGDTTICNGQCANIYVTGGTSLKSTTNYTVGTIPYLPQPYNAGTQILIGTDDYYSDVIPLPFEFCYFGNKYTSCLIGPNGQICFDLTQATNLCQWNISPLPGGNNTGSINAIMGPAHDMYPPSGGTIKWAVYGQAPCRTFVVSWYQLPIYLPPNACGVATQQTVLYESTYAIDVFIENMPLCNVSTSNGAATLGIEDASGTQFVTAPGRNGTIWSAQNEGWRFLPDGPPQWTFRWYDQAGTEVQVNTIPGDTATVAYNICPTQPTFYRIKAVASTNCDSLVFWDTITVQLAQGPPVGPITKVDPSKCGFSDGSFTITGLAPNAPFILKYTYNGSPQAPLSVTSTGGGTVTIPNLPAGVYSNMYISIPAGCFTGPLNVVLKDPPLTLGSISKTDPTGCGYTDGSFTLHGLMPSTSFTVQYSLNGNPMTPFVGLTDGAGNITITGISAGIVNGIDITLTGGCTIGPYGPLTFTEPSVHIDSINVKDPTTCGTATGTVYIFGVLPNKQYSFNYTLNGNPQSPLNATSDANGLITINTLGSGTYVMSVTYNACNTNSLTFTLNDPQFTSSFVHSIKLGCGGDTVKFVNQSVNATGFNWDFGDGATSTDPNPTHIYTAQGIYTVILHTMNGSCDKPDTSIIELNHPVQAIFTAVRDSICEGQTVHFNGYASINADRYIWNYGDGSKPDTTLSWEIDHTYDHQGIFTASLTVNDFVPCYNTATHQITVAQFRIYPLHQDTTVCIYEPMKIETVLDMPNYVYSQTVLSYAWSPATDLIDSTVQEPYFYAADTQTHTYIVTMTSSAPWSCTMSNVVKIFAQPHVFLENVTPKVMIKYGESVHLNADGAYHYTWTPTRFLDNPDIKDPIATPTEPTVFTVYGMNEYGGCRDTATIFVDLNYDNEFLPSAFTPNQDGKNDYFRLTNMKNVLKLLEFRVYNRWGQMIFQTTDAATGWDGNANGKACDAGVYTYYIRIALPDGTNKVLKGDVTLIR